MRQEFLQPRPAAGGVLWALVLLAAAACFLSATQKVGAATFCVSNAAELQTALDDAAVNGVDDTIMVRRGTYSGNFSFGSHEHRSLTIRGGYDPFGPTCLKRSDDPSTTILDAGGSGTVLGLYQHAGGGVHVEGLTLQNGSHRGGLWVRLINENGDPSIDHIHLINTVIKDNRGMCGVYMMSEPDDYDVGPIWIEDNVIQGNMGDYSGIRVEANWTYLGNSIVLRNNLVVGNVSTIGAGGVHILDSDQGNVYLTNNTIVDNETVAVVFASGGLYVSIGTALHAYNNIIRGNLSATVADDIDVVSWTPGATADGFNNDYNEMSGSWTLEGQNLNVDPDFVSPGFWHDNGTVGDPADDYWVAGDYHLGPGSACIDAGSDASPGPGALPPEDFDGDPRVMDGNGDQVATVDIGADESSVIFSDGFESGGTLAWSRTVGGVP